MPSSNQSVESANDALRSHLTTILGDINKHESLTPGQSCQLINNLTFIINYKTKTTPAIHPADGIHLVLAKKREDCYQMSLIVGTEVYIKKAEAIMYGNVSESEEKALQCFAEKVMEEVAKCVGNLEHGKPRRGKMKRDKAPKQEDIENEE